MRLSLTSTSNTDTTHLCIVPIPNIVLIMRTRLSLGLHMDFAATFTLIRFRMPPFLIQRKRIQISASTLAFSTVHTSYEKTIRFRSPWETDYRVHDVSVLENLRFRRFRPSTLIRKASAFERLHLGRRFRKPPFSWVKVSVFHRISVDDRRKRIQKYAFSKKNGLVWTGPDRESFEHRVILLIPLLVSKRLF